MEILERPLVQVLLPVFNAQQHILECLLSIKQQTLKNFSVLILDDCSNDNTVNLIEDFIRTDKRFVLITNDHNIGIIPSRNRLIDESDCDVIAFMDADDVCETSRLEIQYKYLIDHEEIFAVGSWYERFGKISDIVRPPSSHLEIKIGMMLTNMLCNPSVMLKKICLIESGLRCDINYRGAADFKLWFDVSCLYKVANIPKVLLSYRIHDTQESTVNNMRQKEAHWRIVQEAWYNLGFEVERSELSPLIWPLETTIDELKISGIWIKSSLEKSTLADKNAELKNFVELRFKSCCKQFGIKGLFSYLKVYGFKRFFKGRRMGVSFLVDCLYSSF